MLIQISLLKFCLCCSYTLGVVSVINRQDCCQARIQNFQMVLMMDGAVVSSTPYEFVGAESRYEWNLNLNLSPKPSPTPSPEPSPTPSPQPSPTPSPQPSPTPSPVPGNHCGGSFTWYINFCLNLHVRSSDDHTFG